MRYILIIVSLLSFFNLSSQVVINEIVASNVSTASDENGEFDDWIELYNNGNEAVDLSGYFLSDNPDNPGKWEFAEGTSIAGNGYLIIWADEDGSQGDLHASFKLSKDGETLALSGQDTIPFENLEFGVQEINKAFAREPNGTGSFVSKGATFGSNNDTSSNTDEHPVPGFSMYPNPCTESLTISHEANNPVSFNIFDIKGNLIGQETTLDKTIINTEAWKPGIYFIENDQFSVPVVKQ